MPRNLQKTMKASEVISALQAAIAEKGDLPVYLNDPDTEWPLGISIGVEGHESVVEPCFTIEASYYSD